MIVWMVLTSMVAVAVAGLTMSLARRTGASNVRDTTLSILKAQLADIDAQSASGALPEHEANALAKEVKRRILAEGRESEPPPRPIPAPQLVWVALSVAAVVAFSATGLYATIGRPDLAASAAGSAMLAEGQGVPVPHPVGDVATMIAQLEARMSTAPDDAEGWRMLGWSYLETGRAAEAANAYGRAASLDPANAEYRSAEGDALVHAAGGEVTPAARVAFRAALAIDPADPRARYFLAVFKDQQGDAAGAMDDWIALINDAPPGAPWAIEIRDFVEALARERGQDISDRLPASPAAVSPPDLSGPGPTPEQIAAVGQMSADQQQAMIQGMVDGLEAELRANPNNAEGWMRLMRARMVLGEPDAAAAHYRDALNAFAGAPAEQAALQDVARALGVPGA